MSGKVWRLIDSGDGSGPWNMAVDEALLASFRPGLSLPVFRLYGWEPPALSLGRSQRGDGLLDPGRCRAAGISVVRRVTGGGVIFHTDEITYSLVCSPAGLSGTGTVKDDFRTLTGFLLDFYRGLGLDAVYAGDAPRPGEKLGARAEFCFAGRERCDILVNGGKIGGNAQRRLRDVLLQHGSIPLENRAAEGAAFLLRPPELPPGEVNSLGQLGVTRTVPELKQLLTAAFAASLGIRLQESGLTPEETALAVQLLAEKERER